MGASERQRCNPVGSIGLTAPRKSVEVASETLRCADTRRRLAVPEQASFDAVTDTGKFCPVN